MKQTTEGLNHTHGKMVAHYDYTKEPASLHHVHQHHNKPHEDLQLGSRVNLKMMFPVSFRYSLQQSVMLIAILAVALAASVKFIGLGGVVYPSTPAEILVAGCVHFLVLILVLKIVHEELKRHALQYETDGFRLVITRGILFKNEGSLPLLPVTEIFVKRDFLDFLFGLYELHVATPVNAARAFGLIEGLKYKDAHALEKFLANQLNRQIFVTDKKEEDQIQ